MNTANQAEKLFAEACELPPADRLRFVAEACSGNATLEQEVRSLLSYFDDDETDDDHATVDLLIGAHIDRYAIKSKLGEGGFGVVYLAEQTLPISRTVAIKVIKRGMDTDAVVDRFKAERQALAVLDHPNVAGIFDAGSTDDGRPYFVMEYVHGVPISDYCNAESLSVTERIQLVQAVCDAIQHAHNKGVIHRDIKPGNVLVTTEDGLPTVKVIDFGIAKALKGDSDASVTLTLAGVLVGTPDYMSPEQADGSHIDIDTRSDVYSIGALLYELLAGVPPFAGKLHGRGINEMLRIICEDDPAKPSTRFLEEARAPEATYGRKQREQPSHSFARKLKGDLDCIVMRCLEKDRERRYRTVADLASDLGRYLNGQPVDAGPASRVYRIKKMVRRNKAASTACAALLATIVAGTAVSLVYARRASVFATEAIVQRSHALKALESEQAIVKFQKDYLANMVQRERQVFGRQDILRRLHDYSLQIDSSALDGSLTEVRLRHIIAELMLSIDSPDEAIGQLKRSPKLNGSTSSGERIAHVKQLLLKASALEKQGNLDEAIAIMEVANQATQNDPQLAETHRIDVVTTLGRLMRLTRSHEDTRTAHESDFQRTMAQYGEDHKLTVASMREHSLSLSSIGLLAEGQDLRKRADRIELQSKWATPDSIAESKLGLGVELMRLELFEEASLYLVSWAEFLEENKKEEFQADQAYTYVGTCFLRVGDLDNAVEWMDRISLPLPNRKYKVHTAMTWGYLGGELSEQGRFDEAERQYAKCLATLRPFVSRYENDFYLGSLLGHSVCLGKLGRYTEELTAMQEVLEIQTERYGSNSPQALKTQNSIKLILERTKGGVRGY